VQHVEERGEQRLEILFVRLVGREARLKRRTCCGARPFAVNLEELRRLLRDDVCVAAPMPLAVTDLSSLACPHSSDWRLRQFRFLLAAPEWVRRTPKDSM